MEPYSGGRGSKRMILSIKTIEIWMKQWNEMLMEVTTRNFLLGMRNGNIRDVVNPRKIVEAGHSDVGHGKMQWYAFHGEPPSSSHNLEVITLISETLEHMILQRDIYARDLINT